MEVKCFHVTCRYRPGGSGIAAVSKREYVHIGLIVVSKYNCHHSSISRYTCHITSAPNGSPQSLCSPFGGCMDLMA